jgi:hypothetical protein
MHQGVSFFLAGFPGIDRGEDGGFLPKGARGRYYLFKFSTLTWGDERGTSKRGRGGQGEIIWGDFGSQHTFKTFRINVFRQLNN